MLGENTATAYHSGREFARCSRYMLSPDCSLWPLKVRLISVTINGGSKVLTLMKSRPVTRTGLA